MLNFLKYNNVAAITVSVLLMGTSAFAATNPQAVLSSAQKVISVDNTYLANKDLSTWTPQVVITGVTENTDSYFVTYDFTTIDVVNYVWQDVTKHESITVSKADLRDRDLGLYVTGLLKNIVGNEGASLAQAQQQARASMTQKVVATSYGGLVGKLLNDSTQTLPGYTPVVPQPVAAPTDPASPAAQAASAAAATPVAVAVQPGLTQDQVEQLIQQKIDQLLAGQTQTPAAPSTPAPVVGTLPTVSISGDNPAFITVGSTYNDLGATAQDNAGHDLTVHTFLNGSLLEPITIDTSSVATDTINYVATDTWGNTATGTRTVIIQ